MNALKANKFLDFVCSKLDSRLDDLEKLDRSNNSKLTAIKDGVEDIKGLLEISDIDDAYHKSNEARSIINEFKIYFQESQTTKEGLTTSIITFEQESETVNYNEVLKTNLLNNLEKRQRLNSPTSRSKMPTNKSPNSRLYASKSPVSRFPTQIKDFTKSPTSIQNIQAIKPRPESPNRNLTSRTDTDRVGRSHTPEIANSDMKLLKLTLIAKPVERSKTPIFKRNDNNTRSQTARIMKKETSPPVSNRIPRVKQSTIKADENSKGPTSPLRLRALSKSASCIVEVIQLKSRLTSKVSSKANLLDNFTAEKKTIPNQRTLTPIKSQIGLDESKTIKPTTNRSKTPTRQLKTTEETLIRTQTTTPKSSSPKKIVKNSNTGKTSTGGVSNDKQTLKTNKKYSEGVIDWRKS